MLLATRLMRKPITLQDTGKKIGKIKNLYINFDVGEAILSYVGYDHPVPFKDKLTDYGAMAVDRAASAGLHAHHVGAAESPEFDQLAMKEEFIIKNNEIVTLDKHGIVVKNVGIDLFQTEITPGIPLHELLTMDIMTLDGRIVGSVSDVVLDKTKVLGIQVFPEGAVFMRVPLYVPVSRIKNIYDFTVFLDYEELPVDKATDMEYIATEHRKGRSE